MFNLLKGRTNRVVYWLCVGVIIALTFLFKAIAPDSSGISEVVLIILCVPRLHDIGLSGWWVLVGIAVEIVAAVALFMLLPMEQTTLVLEVVNLTIGVLIIVLGAIPGQKADNRFGPPPAPGLSMKKPV